MSTYKKLCLLLALGVSGVAQAGSLIDPDGYKALVSDRRAYEVGDALTVLVVESTTAESAAGTGANGATEISASAHNSDRQYGAGLAIAGDTTGAGQTSRRGQVRTKVAVRVTEKLPGGLLRIAGDQTVTVNDEKQHITISGLVRPDDITGDNTVPSHRLAEASIEIVGDGVVAQAQKQNIIFRVLKWLRLI